MLANSLFSFFLPFIGESTVFTSNGEWDMIGLSSCNNVEFYPDDPGIPYTDVTFYINFSRRAHFYVFNLMMPSLLITLLASLAFLLPPQSPRQSQPWSNISAFYDCLSHDRGGIYTTYEHSPSNR